MENTLENKAKFFAQYYDQVVLVKNDEKVFVSGVSLKETINGYANYYLEIIPLSSITDEDAIEVGKIFIPQSSILIDKEYLKYGKINTIDKAMGFVPVYQYLQSKGYAVPFHGLSIDDLIEYGWVKLKEVKS